MRAVKQLPFSVEPVVEDRITRVRCRLRYGPVMERASRAGALPDDPAPPAGCIPRASRRPKPAPSSGTACASTSSRTASSASTATAVQVDAVIAADGANGIDREGARARPARSSTASPSKEPPYDAAAGDDWRGMLVLELATVPGGYGWIFPKGDHVNVGVGGWGAEGPRLREHLRVLCEHYGIEPDELSNLRGHRLPMRRSADDVRARARARSSAMRRACSTLSPATGCTRRSSPGASQQSTSSLTARRLRGSRPPRARPARLRRLGREEGPRPLSAGRLLDHAAARHMAGAGEADARRGRPSRGSARAPAALR